MKKAIIAAMMLMVAATAAFARYVSVDVNGNETNVGSSVFASGELSSQADGTQLLVLNDMKGETVARFVYASFPDRLLSREFLFEGEPYLHLPLADGDTIYRHNENLYGKKGLYSQVKGMYENWASKKRSTDYGLVSVEKDGDSDTQVTVIRWYDTKSGMLRAIGRYSDISYNTVHVVGSQKRYHKSTGELFSDIVYASNKKIGARYYDTKGRLERVYTYDGSSYVMTHYFPATDGSEHGAVRREEVCDKDGKITGNVYDENGKKLKFMPFLIDPQYPGGKDKCTRFIKKNLRYPKEAQDLKVQGRVMLQFYVDEDGSLSDIKALFSPHQSLTDEAIRVVMKMKKWKPALQDGKPKRVKTKLPVTFYLPDE
ncbi:MAG: energy transducer TonB [Bacteroidales bacterium]|nr:energy transducer TonB [Candidatus Liminaster caballi]